MHNPYLAMAAAALAAWIFGAIWYGVLGKTWMAAQGISEAEIAARRQARKMPLVPMVASFVCELVMAVVLSMLLAGLGATDLLTAAVTGLVLGVAFVATSILVNNLFQGRKLMLSLIDSAHWIMVLVIECVVLEMVS
jgi:hypothetical protein